MCNWIFTNKKAAHHQELPSQDKNQRNLKGGDTCCLPDFYFMLSCHVRIFPENHSDNCHQKQHNMRGLSRTRWGLSLTNITAQVSHESWRKIFSKHACRFFQRGHNKSPSTSVCESRNSIASLIMGLWSSLSWSKVLPVIPQPARTFDMSFSVQLPD